MKIVNHYIVNMFLNVPENFQGIKCLLIALLLILFVYFYSNNLDSNCLAITTVASQCSTFLYLAVLSCFT